MISKFEHSLMPWFPETGQLGDGEAVRAARVLDHPAVLVEGAGHSPHVECPKVVANIIRGFLDQTGREDV